MNPKGFAGCNRYRWVVIVFGHMPVSNWVLTAASDILPA